MKSAGATVASGFGGSQGYINGLFGIEKQRYASKLQCLYDVVGPDDEESLKKLDPYGKADECSVDDISMWQPVNFPIIYLYIIETPVMKGKFTCARCVCQFSGWSYIMVLKIMSVESYS